MVHINCNLSNEAYKIVSDVKIDKNLTRLEDALEKILKEYKILKGGDKR